MKKRNVIKVDMSDWNIDEWIEKIDKAIDCSIDNSDYGWSIHRNIDRSKVVKIFEEVMSCFFADQDDGFDLYGWIERRGISFTTGSNLPDAEILIPWSELAARGNDASEIREVLALLRARIDLLEKLSDSDLEDRATWAFEALKNKKLLRSV